MTHFSSRLISGLGHPLTAITGWAVALLLATPVLAQPTLTSSFPTRNQRTAPRAATVGLAFSQNIAASTADRIRLYSQQRGGQLVKPGTAVSGNTSNIVFDPATDFRPGETLYLTVPSGVQNTVAQAAIPHVFQFTAATGGLGAGNFLPPATNADPGVGTTPVGVAAGDVDADGDLDLVTANSNASTVSLRLNNGAGSFSAPATNPEISVASQPSSVVLADVDGDGDLDILTANPNNGTVSLRVNNGTGTFTAPATNPEVSLTPGSAEATVGDLDADGDLDLVVSNIANGTVHVRFNNGAGVFTGGSNPGVGTSPQSVALGDVDADGDLDILCANSGTNTVSIRLNNGVGSFSGGSDPGVGTFPSQVIVGDVDGDGDLDLLTANKDANSVSVRLNNSSGSFTAPATGAEVSIANSPRSLALGDVDADGDLDLLATNTGSSLGNTTVSVQLNDGTGIFTAAPTNPAPTTGSGPNSIVLADVDGDGDLDFLTANYASASVSVRLNQPLPPTITSFNPTSGVAGTVVTITGTNLSNATAVSVNGTAGTTLTSNTATSLTFTVGTGATTGTISVTTPGGSGTSAGTFTVLPLTITAVTPTRNLRNAAATSDVAVTFSQSIQNTTANQQALRVFSHQRGGRMFGSAGGAATVSGSTLTFNPTTNFKPGETVFATTIAGVTASGGGTLARGQVQQFTVAAGGTGTGTFSGGSDPGVGTTPLSVAVGDVDGDGDLDMVTANYGSNSGGGTTASVRINNGSGTFSGGSTVTVGSSPASVALGDMDGDGDLDLLTANVGNNNVSIRLNDGTGNFSGGSNVSVGAAPFSVAVGDVDADGDLDLFTANYTSTTSTGTVTVRLNDGTGAFVGGANVTVGITPIGVAVGDLDGDGDLDLVAANLTSSTVSVRFNDGIGNYSGGSDPGVGATPQGVALGDVDGDGDLDLLTPNDNSSTVSVRLNNGGGTFTAPATNPEVSVGSTPRGLALGDVDHDGDLDLLATSGGSFAVSVRLNNGAGSFSGGSDPNVSAQTFGVALGDVDGDGDLDFFATGLNSNAVAVRLNTSPVATISSFSPTSGPVGTNVVITGANLSGATAVSVNGTAGVITNSSASSLTFLVAAGSTTGPISVVTPQGTATSASSFTVIPPPTISSFSPSSGPVGTVVTVTGTNLSGATAASVNGTAGTSLTGNTATSLIFTVGAGSTTGLVSVTTPGGTATSASAFTVGLPPTITSFSPTSGPVGTNVVITGTNLSAATSVRVNGTAGTITNSSASSLTFLVAAGSTTGLVSVTTPDGTATSASSFTVILPPSITSFTPTSGPAGTVVTVTGTNLSGATAASVNGTAGTSLTGNTATSLIFTVGAGSTTGLVSVTTPGGTATSNSSFTVGLLPTITSFSPTSGPVGTNVVITGTNLSAATSVRVNGTAGTITNSSASSLTFLVAAGSTTGLVSVTTPDGTATSASSFTVILPPSITSFTPTSGPAGTVVTVTGTNLSGATAASVNGTAGTTLTGNTATSLTFTVGAGSTTGFVGVTTPGGTASSAASFTVSSGNAMTITALSPTRNLRNAAAGADVAVTFSQNLQNTTATQQALRVFSHQRGGLMFGSSRGVVSVSGQTLTFNPTNNFKPGETLLVTTTTGATSVGGATLARGHVHQLTAAVSGPGRGNFRPPVTNAEVSAGVGTTDVAPGDVDGDGDLDLVAANFTDNTVSVRFNDGTGNFSGSSTVNVLQGPASVALGDVDGDGDLDFVTANLGATANGTSVSIRLNNGSGTFASGSDVGVGNGANSAVLGDVDGDGDLDLLCANYSSATVSVRLNNGSGTFTAPASNSNPAVGSGTIGVVVGDVDGDGDLDLLAANYNASSVSVRLNDGTGSFTGGSDLALSDAPYGLAVGDADGDGDLDLFTNNYGTGRVSVLLNNGSGTFSGSSTIGVGATPYRMALGDVDGDGDLDFVTANYSSNTANVRLNNGSGTFTVPANNPSSAVGSFARGVALGDVDGDGDLDILTANYSSNTVSVRLNQPPAPTITSFSPGNGPVGTVVTITGTNLSGATAVSVNGTAGTTLTGTTATSLTFTVGAGTTTGTISVTTPGGTGTSAGSFTVIQPPTITGFSPTSGSVGTVVTITGTNLSGATAVSVNGTAGTTLTGNTVTSLTFTVAAGSTTGTVSVTTPGGTGTSAGSFTVIQPPTITGFSPTSGSVGTVVTLTGTNLSGATAVSVNGTAGTTLTGNTATSLTFTVGAGSSTGTISVTTPGGTATSAGSFTVVPALTVTALSPTRNLRNAAATSDVAVTFSQTLQNTTATQQAVKVFSQQRGGRLSGTQGGVATVSGSSITFNPTTNFKPGETVLVTTTTAATATNGATLARGYVHQFTTAAGGTGTGNFVAPAINADPSTGGTPWSVAVGDVDGDGDLDFVTGNRSSPSVSVRLNNGAGSYSGTQEVPVLSLTWRVALADVDGDGDLDILSANYGSGGSGSTVSVRLNNGTGTFTAPAINPDPNVGPGPRGLAVGDVDGDGDLDFVVPREIGTTVAVRLNDGTGNFTAPTTNPNPTVGNNPQHVALADVDGDGDLDLLAASHSDAAVGIRLNDGTGNFTGTLSVPTGDSPWSVTVGDVDSDGDLDLLTANFTANTASVRLNDGTGAFSGGQTLSVGTTAINVTVGDVDGDGDLDLLTANLSSSTVSVRLNNGAGTFSGAGTVSVGGNPQGMALGDVDGDGDLDILTANSGSSTVSVRLNQAFPPTITSFSPTTGSVGTVVTITGTNLSNATAVSVNGTPGASLTGNTATSLTFTVAAGSSTGTISVTTPGGTATSAGTFTVVPAMTITVLSPTRNLRAAAASADVAVTFSQTLQNTPATQQALNIFSQQRGGRLSGTQGGVASVSGSTITFNPTTNFKPGETVFATTTTAATATGGGTLARGHVHQFTAAAGGTGGGYFQQPATNPNPSVGSFPVHVALGDVDGDGDLDLLAANSGAGSGTTASVLLNDGTGTYGGAQNVSVGTSPQGIVTADVDGDGDLDLLTANSVSNSVSVRLNNGTGAFSGSHDVPVGSGARALAVGDVDGDGDLDLLTANYGSGANSVSVRLNDGSGTFSGGSDVSVGSRPISVAVGDVDGDGDLDMFTANQGAGSGNTVSMRLNDGAGTFTAPATTPEVSVGASPHSVALGDLDGDGDLDLLSCNYSSSNGSASVRLNNGAGSFTPPATNSEISVGNFANVAALGDVDADGDLDFVVSRNGNVAGVWLNNGSGTFAPPATNPTVGVGSGAFGLALGDLDGDGDLDFVTANFQAHTVSVRLNAGPPSLTGLSPTAGPVGTVVTITGTGFTGATGVSFNGTAAVTFSVTNATTATATVPTGATTGNVTITTPLGTSNGVSFTVSAAVTAVTRLLPSPAGTAAVTFGVTFSAPVTGLSASNFSLTAPGLSGASVTSVTGSGSAYTVTVNTGSGDGTLRLDVANAAGVSPALSNVPYTSGQAYTITKTFTSPVLTIQGTGGSVSGSDVTAFVDQVQLLDASTSALIGGAVANPSFETHGALANGSYGYNPTGASWTFNTQSGIANNGSAFSPPPTPNGLAVAFLQQLGRIEQALTAPVGSLQVRFQAGQRNTNQSDQALNVFINGVYVGRIQPANNNAYTAFTSDAFTVNAVAPTDLALTNNSVPENAASGTPVGTLSTTSPTPGETYSYALVSGTGSADNASFAIAGNTLQTAAALNFETQSSYSVRVRTTNTANASLSFEKVFTIAVTNVNETPLTPIDANAATNTVAENAATGTSVGITAQTTDPDAGASLTYSLTDNAGGRFAINPSTGVVTVANGTLLNFEAAASHVITVQVSDGTLSSSQSFTIAVTNVNEAPTVSPATFSLAENSPAGTAVGTVAATDPDAGTILSYAITGGNTGGAFTFVGNQLRVANPAMLDFETTPTFTLTVQVSDGALTDQATVTVNLTDVNENAAPTALGLSPQSVAENTAGGTAIGTFSTTDPDAGDTFTYTLVSGAGSADNGAFSINGGQLVITAAPDYETQPSYAIRVRATDQGGLWTEQLFTITVTDVAEDLVISTPQNVPGGLYHDITVTDGGVAILTADVTATGTVLVQAGGKLQFRSSAGCAIIDGPGSFVVAARSQLSICSPQGISASGATGNVQVTGTRTFSPHATYLYDGTVNQITGSGLPTRVYQLGKFDVATLTLSQPVAVRAAVLLLGPDGDLDLAGHALTLRSDADSTALVVNGNNGAVLGTTGVAQRYLTPGTAATLGYRHLSAPVSGSTVADLAVTGFVPKVNPAYNALPYVALPANQYPNVFGFDETRGGPTADFGTGYYSPASLATPLEPGRGYAVYMKPLTPDFVGTFGNGDVTVTGLTRTGTISSNTDKPGWQLLGNPYPSPVDWDLATIPAGMSASISVYKSTGGNNGGYLTRANGVGTLPAGLVPMGQAFFARVTGAGPVDFTFTNALRPTAYVNPAHYRPAAQPELRPVVQLTLRGTAAPAVEQAAAFVYFQAGATAGLDDRYDGAQPGHNQGSVPTLVSLTTSGEELAVNGLPESALTSGTTVELLLDLPAAGAYVLTPATLTNLAGTGVALLDRLTGTRYDLATTPTVAFTAAQAGAIAGRFALVFAPSAVVTGTSHLSPLTSYLTVYPNPAKGSVQVSGVAAGTQVTLLDATGRVVRQWPAAISSLPAPRSSLLELTGLPAGVYVVRAGTQTQRLVIE